MKVYTQYGTARWFFADYLRGYGNLIILDHGAGYFTVYGNNATLEKTSETKFKAGDVISRAGKNEGAVSVLLILNLRSQWETN